MATTLTKKPLYFVTDNPGKVNEAKKLFHSNTYELVHYKLDLPEYQEKTSEEIALKKCLEAECSLPENIYPFFIEDTGLHFNCLNGLPGPYIKWFMKGIGNDGLVKLTEPFTDKTCYAQCVITLKLNNKTQPKSLIGRLDGTIVSARGTNGFGWDPIIEIDSKAVAEVVGKPIEEVKPLTFGEMDLDTKNKFSHRFKAFKQLSEIL